MSVGASPEEWDAGVNKAMKADKDEKDRQAYDVTQTDLESQRKRGRASTVLSQKAQSSGASDSLMTSGIARKSLLGA